MITITLRKNENNSLIITSSNNIELYKKGIQAFNQDNFIPYGDVAYKARYNRDIGTSVAMVATLTLQAQTLASIILECEANDLPFTFSMPNEHTIQGPTDLRIAQLSLALTEEDAVRLYEELGKELRKSNLGWNQGKRQFN